MRTLRGTCLPSRAIFGLDHANPISLAAGYREHNDHVGQKNQDNLGLVMISTCHTTNKIVYAEGGLLEFIILLQSLALLLQSLLYHQRGPWLS
jgi:hypothetical protein